MRWLRGWKKRGGGVVASNEAKVFFEDSLSNLAPLAKTDLALLAEIGFTLLADQDWSLLLGYLDAGHVYFLYSLF